MESDPSYQSLLQMGISAVMAEASIKKTGSNDISTLLDWISSHENQEPQLTEWLKSAPVSQPAPPQGISHLVNADLNAELQSLGNSVNVSEKALLLNGNNKQKALRWIDDHKFDHDFEEVLVLAEQPESNLTKQEIEAKLQELIKKTRERREKEEAEQALEREKNRMRSGKEALEVKRITEEQRMKQQIDLDKIQKQKDEKYRKELLVEMEKQRCQKLGIPYVPKEEIEAKKEKPKLSKSEAVYVQLEQVRVGNYAYPEKAKTLYDTTAIYLNNIIKDPSELKFRRINTEGSAFQNRIAAAFGGRQLIESIGFTPDGTFLVLENPDVEELKEIVKALEKLSAQY